MVIYDSKQTIYDTLADRIKILYEIMYDYYGAMQLSDYDQPGRETWVKHSQLFLHKILAGATSSTYPTARDMARLAKL